ncbi:protein-L-isoaspartate(D-aspartate) O-methyltransferase [Parvibaculum sedimenti]|uniref:Protein-L-isoaspartate O-methyltransferase n=1 Tax=Parvibaculum sedimenti TaxID=2608632 RepID=A0A6N6VH24_9HYPH|nr:protein-L-isoaspartate(D-aspartate) O-methyltransferase [Parvibaculum sedimenti]KAB7739638.1 protein-L-isoaspartate(D-aspartate) O-methyltransferase [Parvibaculum sedimenti]
MSDETPMDDIDQGKIELVMALRRQGIRDKRVLNALERIPRENFINASFRKQAYEDHALPIECGQTISQPFIVAYMTEQLQVGDRMKVLEVGTGSGYQAAVLSKLCRRVYTVERYRTLLRDAVRRFEDLHLHNITAKAGDGNEGWIEQAPFDRIIVTAAAPSVPPKLVEQLKPGGLMIVPVGAPGGRGEQHLVRIERTEEGVRREELMSVRFVPLVEGVAKES